MGLNRVGKRDEHPWRNVSIVRNRGQERSPGWPLERDTTEVSFIRP